MNYFFEGFLLQAGLILGLGAQNLFVIDVGIRKRSHILIASVCALCDALLIALGVLGAATIFIQVPWLKFGLGVLGVGFLVVYALMKIREGLFPHKVKHQDLGNFTPKKAIALALGFSLLNPHVYLDTVILIGGYASKFLEFEKRIYFGAGAASFSTLWFFGLAILSSSLGKLLTKPNALRILNFGAGIVLMALGLKLGQEVYSWYDLIFI